MKGFNTYIEEGVHDPGIFKAFFTAGGPGSGKSYVATKGAIISMTRSLARELGKDGIGITAVAPGILTTESTEYVPAERHNLYNENRAIKGPQEASEITSTISFLLLCDSQ